MLKKSPLNFLILFAITQIVFHLPSFATNYYIATSSKGGNVANNGTSLASPFLTIEAAIAKATVPGDTIFVRSGVYPVSATVRITVSGSASKHIVLAVYKPDMINSSSRPVFDFSSMTVASTNRGFLLVGANYWDIYGIIIKGAGDNGMNIGGSTSYTTVEFCSFLRNRDTGLQMGGLSHHITVINCDSYENADLGPGTTSAGGNADGYAPKLDVGDSILFRGCRAWGNSDDGWDGYMRTPAGVPDNITTILEDCWAFNNGYYWLDGSTTSSENGNGFKMGGSDGKNQSHIFVLTKCLAFYNKANGFDQNNNTGSIYLYNCTGYNNKFYDYGLNSPGISYRTGAELVLKNNLSLGPKGVSIPSASVTNRTLISVTNSFKTISTSPEILSFDTTGMTSMRNINGDLPVLNFMRLNTSASAPFTYIDKGTILSDVIYHSKKGIPYNGSSPDLGAFESNKGIVNGLDYSESEPELIEIIVYPHPFVSSATVRYTVPVSTNVTIEILNQQGKLIYNVLNEFKEAGQHERLIPGDPLPAGVYFIKLSLGDQVFSKPIIKE